MGLYFNSGNASFYNAVNSRIYVDKTRLLEYTNSMLDTEQRLVCVSRPRRFGKTLTADMLTAYYCKGCNSQNIFADLYISKSEGYLKNLNQYHVIHVDINDFLHRIDSNTMRRVSPMDAITIMQREILREMQEYYSRDYQNEVYLPKVLAEIYDTFGDKFIIIIDEWDAIFREYKDDKEAQDAYLNLLRGLFKDANSRKFLKLAYITGILPIKKTDTQSSLNDFDEFTMVSPGTLAGYVGFTEEEVHNLCEQYHVDFQQMKRWYNGYSFRKVKNIYNPNSVVKAILNEEFDDYWTRTDTYESLKKYISANVEGLKDIIVDMLTGGRCKVNTKKFQNDFTSLYGKDEVLTLLIHLGYLAYDADKKEVYIPNEEILSELNKSMKKNELQIILNGYQNIEKILHDEQVKRCFIVHGHSLEHQELYKELLSIIQNLKIEMVHFSRYTSNPKVEEVQSGVALFEQTNCDFIIAVGGGSAIDVAKCIKQRINAHSQDTSTDHTSNEKIDADYGERKAYVKMLAIPTTAGTGSESTQFAVVYENGEKKSVDDADILPEYVILDADLLKGLPMYQRKSTMLDALCQAIESIWAKKATQESQQLAAEAIQIIIKYYHDYLNDTPKGNEKMIKAANLAGQAINITRTTAAHAMSYKITSLYGVAHGHAVAICLAKLWRHMCFCNEKENNFLEDEQKDKLHSAIQLITKSMNCTDIENAVERFEEILDEMEFDKIVLTNDAQLEELVSSVNAQRLSNHPVDLKKEELCSLYKQILR